MYMIVIISIYKLNIYQPYQYQLVSMNICWHTSLLVNELMYSFQNLCVFLSVSTVHSILFDQFHYNPRNAHKNTQMEYTCTDLMRNFQKLLYFCYDIL